MMTQVIFVAVGGALGAVLRYGVGLAVAFPFGTLAVNVLGSFVIGLVWVWLAARGLQAWAPFVMTGVLGGFTTFSAFSLEAVALYERGALGLAAIYVVANVTFSIAALMLGLALGRSLA